MTQVTQQKLESVSVAAALVLFVAAPQEQESFVAPFYNPPPHVTSVTLAKTFALSCSFLITYRYRRISNQWFVINTTRNTDGLDLPKWTSYFISLP